MSRTEVTSEKSNKQVINVCNRFLSLEWFRLFISAHFLTHRWLGFLRNGSSLPEDGMPGVTFSSTCSPLSPLALGIECIRLPVRSSRAGCERRVTHSHLKASLFPQPARAASPPAWLSSPAPRTPQIQTCSMASVCSWCRYVPPAGGKDPEWWAKQ